MQKLLHDFGVTALFGTLIIVGSFAAIIIGVVTGGLSFDVLMPVLGSWVGAIVAAYFVIKSSKSGGNGSATT